MTKVKNMNKQLKKSVEDSILTQDNLTALAEFGRRLRILRKTADMTQGELAEKMRVTASAINKYESTENVFPSIEILLKLSIFFNVSTDFLLLGIKNSSNNENTISGEVKNSSVVQANRGSSVSHQNENLSPEAQSLANVYENLNTRNKAKLLTHAFEMRARELEETETEKAL